MKKAWRTNWKGTVSIVAAVTRGKALARTFHSIDEAGYVTHRNRREIWNAIRVTRAPEFDGWAEQDSSNSLWHENDLPRDKPKAGAA